MFANRNPQSNSFFFELGGVWITIFKSPYRLEENEKYYCVLEAVQNIMCLLLKVSLYLRVAFGDWNYSWSCFILLAALIARIVLINSFADEVNTPSALLKTCLRIFLFAFFCSILLKLDGLSELSWTGAFWYLLLVFPYIPQADVCKKSTQKIRSYWTVFVILILLSVSVVLMSCGAGCSMISGVITINECIFFFPPERLLKKKSTDSCGELVAIFRGSGCDVRVICSSH